MLTSNFSGVTYSNGSFTFNVTAMNTLITNYNTANGTHYPIWDSVTDDFEKFVQFLLVYCNVEYLLKGNTTYNIKPTSITPSNQVYDLRGSLSSRVISIAFPFSNESQVWGDPDSLG